MPLLKIISAIVAFAIMSLSIANAQPVADFEIGEGEESVCVNENIHFTNLSDTSACSGDVSWVWDFGDGATSTVYNPVRNYDAPGTYDVVLTITCDGFSDAELMSISVLPTPDAGFQDVSFTGCAPHTVNFVNTTTQIGGGNIDGYTWNFGDGTSSADENPEHTYTQAGTYTITLEATNENGCTSFASQENAITLSAVPELSLSANPQSHCQTPVNIDFTSNINVTSGLDYDIDWDFGDGGNATIENPSHEYTSNGDYDISLTVTDEYGCTNTIDSIDYVHVHPVTPDYTILDDDSQEITNNITCINTNTYFVCNNAGYDVEWDFGEGSTSSNSTAAFSFSTSGSHNITMTVDPGGVCEASSVINLTVEDPEPTFIVDEDFSCTAPFTVQFTSDASTTIDEYDWLFGDGFDDDQENPSHTYNETGTFTPVLEVVSSNGCEAQYSGPEINISSPSASFSVDTTEGCLGIIFNTSYDSITHPDEITDFTWDFYSNIESLSDPFSSGTEESHAYTDTGEYIISLTVTDTSGCISDFELDVQVGEHHMPLFDTLAYPHLICPQDSLDFYSLSEDPDYIDDYEWLMGDTNSWQWGTFEEQDLEDFMFEEDTGYVQVVHVVNHNGCRDSLYMPDFFYVRGPVIHNIEITHDCEQGTEYLFTLDAVLASEWDWFVYDDAGNQESQHLSTTDTTLICNFTQNGEYWVHALARNDTTGCDYIDSVKVNVIQPVANFDLSPANICAGEPGYSFTESGSEHADSIYWDFGDGENSGWLPPSEDTGEFDAVTHAYDTVGDIEVWLHVQDENGCVDSVMRVLHLMGPMITIDSDYPLEGCTPFNLLIEGEVEADDAISYMSVEVAGNGTDEPAVNGTGLLPFSSEFNINEAGVYDVEITAVSGGCTNTNTYPDFLTLTSLNADFTAASVNDNDRELCAGDAVEFTPDTLYGPDYDYEWDFGDGSPASSELSPVHTYTSPGSYDVSLTVSGNGCTRDEIKTAYIEVEEADAGFSIATTAISCPPFNIEAGDITLDAPELDNATYIWDSDSGNPNAPAGDGYNSYEFSYFEAGDYQLHLEVVTSFGCQDENSVMLNIDGPSGDLYVNGEPVQHNGTVNACLNETLEFSLENTEGLDSLEWTFDDGYSDTVLSTSHIYTSLPNEGNTYDVDASMHGSDCSYPLTVHVMIHDVMSQFSLIDPEYGVPADTAQCSPFVIDLINNSIGDDLTYNWTVEGIGNHTDEDWTGVEFVNDSQQDLVVDISLSVTNAEVGCSDTSSRQVVAGYIPDPQITPDTIICEGDSFHLHASNGSHYLWYPGLYLSDTEVAEPQAMPEEDMTYYVTVTADNGCKNSDSVHIWLQHPVNSSIGSEWDSIVIGESISNFVSVDQENSSILWSPDESISCLDCENPVFNPLEDQDYVVEISDSLSCFTNIYAYSVFVDLSFTLDVPKAFTPEGNEINRLVFVRGHGIRDLKEFAIYNRWGEELFRTDDIKQGWDGYYKGKLQPVDTYVYYVEAEMYNGKIKSKKGTIMLMR